MTNAWPKVGKWHDDNRQCFRSIRARLSKNRILDCFVNTTGPHFLDFTCIRDCEMIERLLGWLDIGFGGNWNVVLLWLMTADDIDARIQYDCLPILLGQMNSEKSFLNLFIYLTMDANRTPQAQALSRWSRWFPPQNGWWTWISINLILVELMPSVPRSLYANGHVLRTTWGGHSILELRKHNETTSFEPWVQILIPKPNFCWGQIFQ